MALLPSLVPVYTHRYLVAREHHAPPRHESPYRTYVPFWSDIATGAHDDEL